jgi:hypothetical protein
MSGPVEIRSYRRVFDLERRIYSVDQLRLNPGGVPVRGIVYFLALLATALLATALPGVRVLAGELPWYLRDLALPAVGAALLSVIRLEGRTFHLAAHALLRHRLSPRRLASGRPCAAPGELWQPDALILLPDGSDSALRRMRYTGPGSVLVCVEHARRGRFVERGERAFARRWCRRSFTLEQLPRTRPAAPTQVISVRRGVRLAVRPVPRRRRGAR